MRAVVQRVKKASVSIEGAVKGMISSGLVVFIGVHADDTESDCLYTSDKILNLRIFNDAENKMNLSLLEIKGEILIISQFTLYGDTRKGRRPSYNHAAPPEKGSLYYNKIVDIIKKRGIKTETGEFGAVMEVEYVNDGPVTILVDSFKDF
ncbi:MAG: D-aminoacyl-tRNA deacylase [Spirochaetia bacterium]|jgi:D-tyrosyl-tRNA(Tyr) deacylase|nr:D-aminoacyl-tRNA deacylase [Spirochaetia bacterium]